MKIWPCFVFLLIPFFSFAQNSGETDLLEFYAIIDVDSLDKKELFRNASEFLEDKENCKFEPDSVQLSIQAQCGFWVYKNKFFKSIDGNINYQLSIDVKDHKYRYKISDFIYYQYARDRYGKYELVKNSAIPLNKNQKNAKGAYDKHKDSIDERIEGLLKELKNEMKEKPEVLSSKKQYDQEW